MKPVLLQMQAFGPYEDLVTVEFDRLGEHPIFLITGPTGGGKTTILDAMCFALYCRATGGRRSWGSMRNTSVPDERETIVDFAFSLGTEAYRFRRSQMVHKVRGSGRREIREEHLCYRKTSGDWELMLSGSETKLREQAQRLLGLTCEQFSQVIVLPQGDFLKLLRANSSNKADILQTLFATKLWADITKQCKSMAEETAQKAGEYRGAIQSVLEREGVETREALEEKNRQLMQAVQVQEKQKMALQAHLEQQTEKLVKAKETAQKLTKQASLKYRWEELSQQKKVMLENREQAVLGRKVRQVLPYVRAWERADQERTEKESRKVQADASLRQAQENLVQAEQNGLQIPIWRAHVEEAKREQIQLQEAYESAVRLTQISDQLAAKEKEIQQQQETKAEAEKRFAETQSRLTEGQKYVEQEQARMQKLTVWMQEVRRLEQERERLLGYQKAKAQWEAAKKAFDVAEQEREKCAVQAEVQRERLEQEEAHLRQDQAYSLASALQEGKPCPVCGSVHHPEPAGSGAGYDAQKLELLRTSVRELEQQLRKKEQRSQLAKGKLEPCTAAFQEQDKNWNQNPMDELLLDAQYKQAKEALDQCQQAERKLKKYQDAIKRLEQEKQQAQEIREQAGKLLQQLETDAAVLRTSQEEVARQVGGMGSPEQIQARQQESAKQAQQWAQKAEHTEQQLAATKTALAVAQTGQASAEQTYQTALANVAQARQTMETEVAKAGLNPNLAWEKVQTDEERLTYLEGQVAEYERECHSVQEQLRAYQQELAGVEPPNLEELEQIQKDAQREAQEAAQRLGGTQRQLEIGTQSLAQLDTLSEEGRRAEERFAKIDRLAKLLQGKNPLKIPLQQFVLGIMLDDVLSYANRFFSMLSQGRYSLRRIAGSSGGNALGGLDLEVLDAHAGGARSIETLSGGEQFLASLSLAFGLSDVVQSYSGSVRLDSIFIDEGFGSLDQDTLDIAMKALGQIQKMGRTIGIISHISELKGRIAARLEIRHSPTGGAAVAMIGAE